MSFWKKIAITLAALFIIVLLVVLPIMLHIYIKAVSWSIIFSFFALYAVNIVFGFYVFYSQKRNDISKKCLLLLFLMLPGLGPLLFLWFGYKPFDKKTKEFIRNKCSQFFYTNKKNNSGTDTLDLLENYNQFNKQPTTAECDVELIEHGEQYFKASIELIRSAKKFIFIQYYLLTDGIWFRTFINELSKKSKQGVKIYILYDWFGLKQKPTFTALKNLNKQPNVFIREFNPKTSVFISAKDNSRCHKKMIIVDNLKAFYGGANISDEYINFSENYEYWKDNNFVISGSIVLNFSKSFIIDWECFTKNKYKNEITHIESWLKYNPKHKKTNAKALVVNCYPELRETLAIAHIALVLQSAKKRIWICTPYLYPTDEIINILIRNSKAGLDVRIYLPRLNDNKKFIINLNHSQYEKLLNANIKIFEVDCFLHSKSVIIDDDLAIIGTANFDPRALWVNYESLCIVKSKKLNQKLRVDIEKNEKYSKMITLDNYHKDKLMYRIFIKVLMLFEPQL